MSETLRKLAGMKTSTELVVDELFRQGRRVRTEQELEKIVSERVRSAVANNFGTSDTFLLDQTGAMNTMILGARRELGIPTPDAAEHLARLETNGPWLEDLDVPPSLEWPAEEVEPGRWARVNHDLKLCTPTCGSLEATSRLTALLQEGALRSMRSRYQDIFPDSDPDETPSP